MARPDRQAGQKMHAVRFAPRLFDVPVRDSSGNLETVQLKVWIYDGEEQSIYWELRRCTKHIFGQQKHFKLHKWIKEWRTHVDVLMARDRVNFNAGVKPITNASRFHPDLGVVFDPIHPRRLEYQH